jgi:hypothetical protein
MSIYTEVRTLLDKYPNTWVNTSTTQLPYIDNMDELLQESLERGTTMSQSALGLPKSGAALEAAIANGKKGSEARRGTHDSDAVKKAKSIKAKALYASNPEHYARPQYEKSYLIEGTIYKGHRAVVAAYGVTRQTVANRINSEKFPDWNEHGNSRYYQSKR